jgi:hypothetical protein
MLTSHLTAPKSEPWEVDFTHSHESLDCAVSGTCILLFKNFQLYVYRKPKTIIVIIIIISVIVIII